MKEKTISSYDEFIDYTEPYKGKYYFRGQKNREWAILPTLFRNGNIPDFEVERQIILSEMADSPKKQPLEAIYFAQHHGKSTRICDLTISPLNALCFAADSGTETDDKDGVVFVIDRSNAIALSSVEVRLLSTVLTGDSQLSSIAAESLSDILTKNYVIDYKDFVYSNERAFRQGGTGIIFGFGLVNGILTPIGSTDIDHLIIEKIFIPSTIKGTVYRQLRSRGISVDILLGTSGEEYLSEDVTIIQTEFKVLRIYDKKHLNKVNAKYKVSSVYFDRDSLFRQIEELYNSLLVKYESDARVWTFFYHDELDITHTNWICRGVWDANEGYRIAWNNSYHTNRFMYQNEEISREEAFDRVMKVANAITPLFEGLNDIIETQTYTLAELRKYTDSIRGKISELFMEAQNIPFTDTEAEKVVEKVLSFINEVEMLVGDTQFYLHRNNVNEKWIRYHVKHTMESCYAKASIFLQILQEWEERDNA